MKKYKYYVIGGQYEAYCYGGADTLLGAKRIAGKHDEYWDNWQGWHRPAIYKAEDCEEAATICCPSGTMIPKLYAVPVAAYDMHTEKWINYEEV